MNTANPVAQALQRIATDLQEMEVAFAVIGGLAVGARGESRFTRDVDVAIAVADDKQAEAVARGLHVRGYGDAAVLINDKSNRLATMRFLPPRLEKTVIVDALFASCGIEPEVVRSAEMAEVMKMEMPVATLPHVLAMKLVSQDSTRRQLDIADIYGLIDHATPAQIDETRRLSQLVIDRGYHRDRDLLGDLDYFIRIARERRESGEVFF